MFEWTPLNLLPLIALALPELIANFVTFAPFLRPASTWGTLSVGIATTIAFGGCSLRVLWISGLALLSDTIAVLPQPFPVNQVLQGLMEKTVRLLMGLSDARSNTSMSYFSNWLGRICHRRMSLSTASSGVVAIPARV